MMFKAKFRSPLMMFLSITLIFMALLTVHPSVTYACSCVVPAEPLEAMESSSAVFTGKVVDKKEPKGTLISSADPVKVTFEVDSSWKGVEGNQVTLTTALSSASCGFEFVEGESYIVYASANGEGESDKLVASLCSRTKLLASASEDLKELGPSISAGTPTASPEVTSNHSPKSGAGNNDPADVTGKPAAGSDSLPLVNVGISGVIIVLIAIAGAVLYRRRDGGTRKK
ncbi:hypothetical protein [Paenibacillus pseudetheri]|uniref:Tissue inhibitor of metalloproteinase n=1 Tax=Paenibacillus pseudetheri TaxID=2897682 RepID=A0ABM9B7U6_9BACL|nr:hypothetical protein [Paenibacillus pseudetheri]CAH1054551.1 hypothetical protein PAECIP111894_00696 [Paenibacillus pseudetheri]